MSWISRCIIISLFLLFEITFLTHIANTEILSYFSPRVLFIALYQLISVIVLILIFNKKFLITSLTIFLLLLVNLFIVKDFSNLKTLPPFMEKSIIITGDTMHGFSGVNRITTDKLGFRTTKEIKYDENIEHRIFTIGASTTEEIFTDDEETWSARLQSELNKNINSNFEVINTGVSGLRATHHLETLKYIEQFHPDFILLLVGVNDWNHHIKSIVADEQSLDRALPSFHFNIANTPLYRFAQYSQYLILQIVDFKKITYESGEFYSVRQNSQTSKIKLEIEITDVEEIYKSNMQLISERCKTNSYKCVFITQPSAYSNEISDILRDRLWMTPPDADYTLSLNNLEKIANVYNTWLKDLAIRHNIHYCDLASELKPSEDYFYDDIHFNEGGSEYISKFIYKCFQYIDNIHP